MSCAVVGLFLLTAGFLLHFVGFKIAVEYNPDLARSIGGVTTEAEQKRMESVYRDHLSQLRESMHTTVNEIRQLETMKNRFMEMATPSVVRDKLNRKDDNKGGPFIAPRPFSLLYSSAFGHRVRPNFARVFANPGCCGGIEHPLAKAVGVAAFFANRHAGARRLSYLQWLWYSK